VSKSSRSPVPGPRRASDAPRSQVDRWLAEAQAGSRSALGQALEAARKYLLLVANQSLDGKLRAKGGASDLVQDTFVEARRDFDKFEGHTEKQLLAWLTEILVNRLKNNRRYWSSQKHDINREIPADHLDGIWGQIGDQQATPGAAAIAREEQRRVQLALAELNEPEREVIVARTFRKEPFVGIGQRCGCSEEAARKRWVRAVRELQKVLKQIR
jgi:RNA polymerase sigma-70 factor (ECF subfamily)